MSGSPSRPSTRTGGSGGDCPSGFEVVLGSPVPAVIASLNAGDLLDFIAMQSPVRGVGAYTMGGDYVGALTRDIARVRECIAKGVQYEGEILDVSGGAVRVYVAIR